MSKPFLLRLSPQLFQAIQQKALAMNTSINSYCALVLQEALRCSSQPKEYESLIQVLKKSYGKDLLGIVLFGSTARKTASASSDIDLLIVLENRTTINTGTYRKWDIDIEGDTTLLSVASKLSPHFVHLPRDIEAPGSLWLEVALEGKIIWESGTHIESTLSKIRQQIAEGLFLRAYSYGVPYWKKVG